MTINSQANELNEKIIQRNKTVYELLSIKGRKIFFPRKGILAQSAQSKGKEINATIGTALEDDFEPLVLNSILKNVNLTKKEAFEYASSYGNIELRKVWKRMLIEKNQTLRNKNFSTPIITCALTHGISIAANLFINPNDEIIIPLPYWENYDLIFENTHDAKIKTFQLFKNDAFNIEGLKKALETDEEKKILLLNFPNNPTGYTPTINETEEIIKTIKEACDNGKKIVCMIDDAYFGLVYEREILIESIFSKLSDLHDNLLAIKIDGATKEDYAWGLRIGFLTYGVKNGDESLYTALEDKTAGAIRASISNAPQLSQLLLLHAYKDDNYKNEKISKFEILKKRYEKTKKTLKNHPEYEKYFKALPFNSGYFMCIKTKVDGEKLRQKLLDEYSTGVILFDNNMIRIAFSATPNLKIEELFYNIYKVSIKLKEEK